MFNRNKIITFVAIFSALASLTAFPDSASAKITATQVTFVMHDKGSFDKISSRIWKEYHAVTGEHLSTLVQVRQSAEWIYLVDDSRNVEIEINVKDRWIRYKEGNDRLHNLYKITHVSSKPNARTITKVFYPSGSFNFDGIAWIEYDNNGREIFRFIETGRTQTAVSSYDETRQMRMVFGLRSMKVHLNWPDHNKMNNYDITSFE